MRICIAEVTADLIAIKRNLAQYFYDDTTGDNNNADCDDDDSENCLDIRLYASEDGSYGINTGDPSYDQDHRGYCGASSIDKRTNCRELAKELIDQAMEQYYCDKPCRDFNEKLRNDEGKVASREVW